MASVSTSPAILSQLPNQTWNGLLRVASLNSLEFPVEHVDVRFSQDIVQHKYPNVPGADIESMSRNPLTFHVRALFLDNLKGFTNLFPTTFQNVMRVLQDPLNETAKFIHPTLGKFNVKVVGGNTMTTFAVRNGQIIDFELIEQGNNDATVQNNVLGIDLIGQTASTAGQFDLNIKQFELDNPASIITPISATDLVNNVVNAIGQTTVQVQVALGQAQNAVSALQRSTKELAAIGNVDTSQMLIEAEGMMAGITKMIFGSQPSRLIYQLKQPMTLNAVLQFLLSKNPRLTIELLIQLNPQLKVNTVLPKDTIVYYNV